MPLDEGIDNGNAEPRAGVSFCGEKRLKNPALDLWRNSGTIVRNLNPGSFIGSAREHVDCALSPNRIYCIE